VGKKFLKWKGENVGSNGELWERKVTRRKRDEGGKRGVKIRGYL
jgi:hypothetical protein